MATRRTAKPAATATPRAPKPAAAAATPRAAKPERPCPICGKPSTTEAHPFCSTRCRQVDLHRWLTGAYAIPVVETDEDDPEA